MCYEWTLTIKAITLHHVLIISLDYNIGDRRIRDQKGFIIVVDVKTCIILLRLIEF